jgi:hypothetical protein
MKPSRTGVPRLPARARSRPRALARPKLSRRLPPTLAVRTTPVAPLEPPPERLPGSHPEAPPRSLREAPPASQSDAVAAEAKAMPAATRDEASNALLMRGDHWEVRFGGHTLMLDDSRGLRYIALLIRDGRSAAGPLHAKELVALADGRRSEATELELTDEILDATAQKQLLARLEEVATERERATALDDLARAAELDEEHERIAAALSAAAAAGGRRRKAGFDHAGEKARKAVAKAISEAIARIGSYPGRAELADHLTATIRKGQWLSYAGNIDWHIDFQPPLPRK